jgi:sporulation protein YlmC with PRC-barrel domain
VDEPLFSCATLAGDRVFDAESNEVGKVARVMIDVPTGKVAYAVLERGGVFGIGSEELTIPWSALRRDPERQCFVLEGEFRSSYKA